MAKKLFVGNLSFTTSDAELKEHFSKAGACQSATILMDRTTGRSRGFGFVEMASDDEATRAITQLNGSDLQGRSINVSEARERSERGPRTSPGFTPSFNPSYSNGDGPKFKKDGGSRRGLRAKKRSL